MAKARAKKENAGAGEGNADDGLCRERGVACI